MIADCTAIILAGGDSQRMGQDKASILLGDQTMLQRVIATMQQIFPHVIVSVREPRPEINLPQICDEHADDVMGAGPLAGLAASLGHIATPWAFVVACDMPFVNPALVDLLASYRSKPLPATSTPQPPCQGENQGRGFRLPPDKGGLRGVWCQAVVPVVQGHPQPLAAFYASSCLDAIRKHLADGGKNSLRAVLEKLQVRYMDEAELLKVDPALRSFFDLDTPQDVVLAMRSSI